MITRRVFVTVIFLSLSFLLFGQREFNPTGTYNYKGKKSRINGTVFGPYVGTIQVMQISSDKIVMTFFICKGAPSYNLGSFVDTLQFVNNTAIFTDQESDSTCRITFSFDRKGVKVKEETENYNAGCGFGHAVVADGYFRKTSSKQPKLVDPLTGEDIK